MMTDSTLLGLPYMDAAQSQKHITHNEALSRLDLSIHISLSAFDVIVPPSAPAEGVRVHVGAGATGAFAGMSGKIAAWQDGAWRFLSPRVGWITWIEPARNLFIHDGASWCNVDTVISNLQNLARLGIGTSADVNNQLAAKLNAALFTARASAEGGTGDLRFNLVKSAAANTVSQLYQTNYSGRAETGLIADDQYRIKVSPDGAAWFNAMVVNSNTGQVTFPAGLSGPGAGFTFRRVETFNSTGTFTKQSGDVLYQVIAIAGGGGGGAGRRSAAATQAGGGAGGNGGHIVEDWLSASALPVSNPMTVGAGGAGAAAALDSLNGAAGSLGGTTTAFTLSARGGAGGNGGTNTAGGASAVANVDVYSISRCRGSAGGAGGASAAGGASPAAGGASGGGGGAGLSTTEVEAAGGVGGTGSQGHSLTTAQGGIAGTIAVPNGGAASLPPSDRFGSGGGGGASKVSLAAGNGGAGSQAGGGGGGGGGGRNGQAGGAGGAGAAGRVIICVYG